MKIKTLGLVHTSATLVPVFAQLCKEKLPGVEVFNIADDSLIKDVIRRGELTPHTARRVTEHVASAEAAGADYILVTCSSIGRAVETAATLAGVPVLRVDQPMADRAVQTGKRIGVVATLPTTLEPTADLIRRRAQKADKEVVITSRLCEGAFAALMSGDAAKHDTLVRSPAGVIHSGGCDCAGPGFHGPRSGGSAGGGQGRADFVQSGPGGGIFDDGYIISVVSCTRWPNTFCIPPP
jgi:glutamate racemase